MKNKYPPLCAETIKTWRIRIRKAGLLNKDFCKEIKLSPAQLSVYLCGRVPPNTKTFDLIENKLRELGV